MTFRISSFAPSQVSEPDCRRPGDLLEGARLPKVDVQVPSGNQGTGAMIPLYLTDEESGAPAAARPSSKPYSLEVRLSCVQTRDVKLSSLALVMSSAQLRTGACPGSCVESQIDLGRETTKD